jgi:hypothetical protein
MAALAMNLMSLEKKNPLMSEQYFFSKGNSFLAD